MRWANGGLGLAMLLAACGQPPAPVKDAPPADSPQARASLQLRARLGGDPDLTGLRHGINEGKDVLCGEASVRGAPPTPFVMRGGFLVLPGDASPDQFATLQSFCTDDGAGAGQGADQRRP